MSFFSHYALFLLESISIVMVVFVFISSIRSMGGKPSQGSLSIKSLDKEHLRVQHLLEKETGRKKTKQRNKQKNACFVLDFKGDVLASQVDALRHEISAVLAVAKPCDEIVIRLESPGGSVNGYGLAAAQLQRIRERNIPLTVCIDQMAASGGYLMACVANHIIASPFAIIGSIGVMAQLPNFHRWLKKHDIDFELLTAGEYKRTLTMLGENTASGRKKFQADLDNIHSVFGNYVLTQRNQLNLKEVATGDHWLAVDAIKLGLVDILSTSDDYLQTRRDQFKTYHVALHVKQPWTHKLLKPLAQCLKAFY